jgi:hypothetical protein
LNLDAPLLSLYYEPNEDLIEDKIYNFYCDKKSAPNTNDYTIYVEDGEQRVYNEYLTLKMDRSLNGKTIFCESENSIGKSVVNHTINIICKS